MSFEPSKNQSAKPGASAKSSAKLAATSGDTKSGLPTKSGSEVAFQECDAIEAELAALKVSYEHYFMGIDRTPPTRTYEDLKKRLERLKNSFVRNTAAKFRVQAIHSKFVTYERLWQRTIQEIENGTYKRDVVKAKRRSQKAGGNKVQSKGPVELPDSGLDTDDLDSMLSSTLKSSPVPSVAPLEPVPFRGGVPSVAPLVPSVAPLVPPVAPVAGAPVRGSPLPSIPPVAPVVPRVAPVVPPVAPAAAAARPPAAPRPAARPASATSASELSEDKLKSVYDAYVAAKRRNKEDTSKMSYDSIAASLRKQVPELMKQHGAKSVEFKVVIKDGKAVLKAVPK
jgi:hypothetical protein